MQIMLLNAVTFHQSTSQIRLFQRLCSSHSLSQSISNAVQTKEYHHILNLLNDPKTSLQNPNPFAFLTSYPQSTQTRIIDQMLQSFISIRPRSRPRLVYSCLLSYTLQTTKHLPLALAIIQRTIRSGCLPLPQTYLFLSKAWLNRRKECESVSSILLEMQSVGYTPDTGTCNYLISSLCKVDHVDEAVRVLKGMIVAGCIPDLDSYGTLICEMCELRMTDGVCVMIKEMVGKFGLNPRQGMVVKMLDTLQANKEIWRAVEVIEFLESWNVYLGFEGYEVVLEGCLESRQFILAAKTAMKMTDRGFIPYIKVRQKMVEGLANIGELELACAVRRRFSELKS
ncbi:hypothetical protein LIER_00477 [Lithospermum erythrorhizon]|uniref:Pentatricopeptide repeat-containing protein n=1 Tax=Lithospermum erythrorhizon TaxID=34254 RepID=A0AAV3NJZ1_LITER